MYLDHFGLTRYPFRLSPDVDFLYMSRGHARAKAYLDYTVVSLDGFVVITGEIGAGKTTLLNTLVAEMTGDVLFLRIDQTQLSATEFLQAVLAEAGLETEAGGKVTLLNELKAFLIRQAEAGQRVVLAVDEAQSLDRKVLEEIRLLSGLEHQKERLISVILLGQPELARVIDAPELEQLSQRVRLRFHLSALTTEETREYVRYRMRVAGAEGDEVFVADAFPAIDLFAGGIPRLINSLCDMALLTAYVDGSDTVTARTVEMAASELNWEPYSARSKGRSEYVGSLGGDEYAGDQGAPRAEVGAEQTERLIAAVESLSDVVRDGFSELAQTLMALDDERKAERQSEDSSESNTISMSRAAPSSKRSSR